MDVSVIQHGLPQAEILREAAARAQHFEKLRPVAGTVLQTTDGELGLQATLSQAAEVFNGQEIPDQEMVMFLAERLDQSETELRAALAALPPLGPADDADYRQAYLDLRLSLVNAVTRLHRLNAHLSHLQDIMDLFLRAD
ncbi:MAG TPA: hypothetical protein PLB56_14720 [Spirochaetales bacterium]|nr:hypothetical protein [Spirochaetales bacterium]